LLKKTVSVLVFENVFIALCAVSMAQVSLAVLQIPSGKIAASCFVFFSTLLVYNMHHSVSMLPSQSLRSVFMLITASQVPRSARFLICCGAAGAMVTYFFLDSTQQILVAALACLTLAYSFPLLKFRDTRKRIREFFFIKVIVIASVWSLVTVFFPVMGEHYSSASLWLLFSERLLFIFAITIPFEIRDLEQEKKWGNTTLPVVLGSEKSKTLGYILVVLFALISGLHYLVLYTSPPLAAAMAGSAASAALVIYCTHEKRTNLYYKLYVDGTMLLQFIFVILFS